MPQPPRASRCYRQRTAHPEDTIRCLLSALFALETDQLRLRPWWKGQAEELLRCFLTICEEIVWFCWESVVAAVQVAGDDDLVGEDAGCRGPGLVWVHKGCEASWMYWTFNWTTAPNLGHLWLCRVTKVHILVVFCCGRLRLTRERIMSEKQFGIPHLWDD